MIGIVATTTASHRIPTRRGRPQATLAWGGAGRGATTIPWPVPPTGAATVLATGSTASVSGVSARHDAVFLVSGMLGF